jgi:error-prone DNA polymerase
MLYRGNDRARLARRAEIRGKPACRSLPSTTCSIITPTGGIAGRAHLHPRAPDDRPGRARLAVNAERYLKPPAEMARLFREARKRSRKHLALDRALTFSLDELRY